MRAGYLGLRHALESFDGKDLRPLERIVKDFELGAENLDALLSFVENEEEIFQVGASWIILNSESVHTHLGRSEKEKVFGILSSDMPWQVILHFLKLFRLLTFEKEEVSRVFPIVVRLLKHQRPFVRAWAYNAVYLAADIDSDLRAVALDHLNCAVADEQSSVLARVRNATQKSSWFEQDV